MTPRFAVLFLACAATVFGGEPVADPALPAALQVVEFPKKTVPESSGLVMSPRYDVKGYWWTLSDSGNPARLVALDRAGAVLREVDIPGAKNIDWEELAADDTGRLIIADIGDNLRKRAGITLYRLKEPDILNPLELPPVPDVFEFSFPAPEGAQDAEGLVFSKDAAILFTKDVTRVRAYRLPLPERAPADGKPVAAELLGEAAQPLNITGAALSPDGKFLALLTYVALTVYEMKTSLHENPRGVLDPANHAAVRARASLLGQSEAITWHGRDLLITTEGAVLYRMSGVRSEP